jgi:dihydroflavonol-4-reductase
MRAFVTGADGLLGANLVRVLLDSGHQVRALIYPGSPSSALDGLDLEREDGDLLDPATDLARTMEGCEAVFHCAAVTDLWADADFTWKVNLEGTRRVLDACLAAGVKRLVYVGSASSFAAGTIEDPGDETGPFPEVYRGAPYMESKHQAADLVRRYVRERGLDAVIVTPTFMLGPYDTRPSGGELIRQFLQKDAGVATPGGRNFAYAPHVAKAMLSAYERGRTGETYILGGQNLTYQEFFTRVAKLAGANEPRRVLPRPLIMAAGFAASAIGKLTRRRMIFNRQLASFSVVGAYYRTDKARQELGLEQTTADTAIEESVKGLRQYGHLEPPGKKSFAGKVALITGASRGVGFATARALVLAGAKVVITARSEGRLEDSRRKLERLGAEVVAIPGDVGSWDEAKKMVAAAVENFGRLDLVINNAGVSMRGDFAELAPEVIERVTRTNLTGCLNVSSAALPHLLQSRGSLVFISSIAGLFGLPGASVYCATKMALTGLAESLRIELIPRGIHVGVVYLGFTEHDPEKRILAADGSLTPPDRPAHHSQARAAKLIVNMISHRRRRLIMTPVGHLGWIIYRISPGLVEKAILTAQSSRLGIFKRFS